MELMIRLMKVENEENALLCIKVMIDGFRNHKEQAEPHVEPFLELVKQMYANTKSVVEKEFGTPASAKPAVSHLYPG
jgi:transformation/transcription domain-associated protein